MKFRILFFSLLMVFSVVIFGQEASEASPASLYNAGVSAIKTKDYTTALEKFSAALEKADPEADVKVIALSKKNGANAAYAIGSSLLKKDDLEGALTAFNKGLELNDQSYVCAYGKAKVLVEQTSPEALDAYFSAAELAKAAGKEDKATEYIERAGKIVSKAYFADDFETTVKSGEMLLEKMDDADTRYYVAKALIKSKKGAEAVPHAMKAKELGGDEKEGKFMMVYAEALEASGDMTAAKKAFAEVPQGKYYEVAQYKVKQ